MRRKINVTDAVIKMYGDKFIEEHNHPVRVSRLQLFHLNHEFDYMEKTFELLGSISEDLIFVYEVETKTYYEVERLAFDQFIIETSKGSSPIPYHGSANGPIKERSIEYKERNLSNTFPGGIDGGKGLFVFDIYK